VGAREFIRSVLFYLVDISCSAIGSLCERSKINKVLTLLTIACNSLSLSPSPSLSLSLSLFLSLSLSRVMSDPFYCLRVGLFTRKIRLFFISRSSSFIPESLFFIIKVCKLLLFVNYYQSNNIKLFFIVYIVLRFFCCIFANRRA